MLEKLVEYKFKPQTDHTDACKLKNYYFSQLI
jgi:hypothetical protein